VVRVAYAAYACTGSEQLGRNIAEAFCDGRGLRHAGEPWGRGGRRDLLDAFQRFETLESVAQTLVRAATIGNSRCCRPIVWSSACRGNQGSWRRLGLPISKRNSAPRSVASCIAPVIDVVHHHGGFILRATRGGAVSDHAAAAGPARAGAAGPRAGDRRGLRARKHPSRTARLHAAIYRLNPEVGAVINAQPANAGAFCVTNAVFSTYTIPESYLVLNKW